MLHGLPTLGIPAHPELTACGRSGSGRRAAGHVFAARLEPTEVTHWFGIPVTTVVRTVVDLARHDRRDGIMAADAALRERLVTRSEIDGALQRAAGWPGARQARDLLALATPLAESPLESVTRLALHDDGFPPPTLQARIGRYRVDFYWPEYGLVVEADGRAKYTDDELWREKRREHRLRREVRWVERVLWSDVLDNWPDTSRRLRTFMR